MQKYKSWALESKQEFMVELTVCLSAWALDIDQTAKRFTETYFAFVTWKHIHNSQQKVKGAHFLSRVHLHSDMNCLLFYYMAQATHHRFLPLLGQTSSERWAMISWRIGTMPRHTNNFISMLSNLDITIGTFPTYEALKADWQVEYLHNLSTQLHSTYTIKELFQ